MLRFPVDWPGRRAASLHPPNPNVTYLSVVLFCPRRKASSFLSMHAVQEKDLFRVAKRQATKVVHGLPQTRPPTRATCVPAASTRLALAPAGRRRGNNSQPQPQVLASCCMHAAAWRTLDHTAACSVRDQTRAWPRTRGRGQPRTCRSRSSVRGPARISCGPPALCGPPLLSLDTIVAATCQWISPRRLWSGVDEEQVVTQSAATALLLWSRGMSDARPA